LFWGCAESVRVNPPRTTLVDPLAYVQIRPTSAFREAYRIYQKGEQPKARIAFQKILKKSPDYYPADLAMAYTYLAEGNLDQAEPYIQKALNYAPDYSQAHFALAQVYESHQDYENALASLDEIEKTDPDYPELHQMRNILKLKATEVHLSEGKRLADTDPETAIRHFQEAEQLAPEIAEIPLQIADVYLKHGQCTEAVPFLEQADQAMPDNVDVKTRLFNCYADLEQYELALAEYNDVSLLKPGDAAMQKRVQGIKHTLALRALPQEYQSIPTTEQITRGQLAAYLALNLEFLKKYSTEGLSSIIVDTLDNWDKAQIQKIVDLGIMDLFPNRTFQSSQPITKLELAKAASRILEILEAGKKVSVPSADTQIPDVPAGSVYFPMVSKPVEAGVISLDNDGRFNAYRPVAGSELISMVKRFQALMEPS
jgi:tetratricopeptide (TPR) repeat protein